MINLYVNYYKCNNLNRQKELDYCYNHNLNNNNLNVITVESDDRITFDIMFNIVNKASSSDDVNIISNLDIYFDHTILLSLDIDKNDCYALSRWDRISNVRIKHFNHDHSQDAWIFKGKPKNVNGNFNFGLRGCDNRIAYELNSAGYNVYNPSNDIRCIHYHMSNIRTYKTMKVVPPPYMVVPVCSINNLIPAKSAN